MMMAQLRTAQMVTLVKRKVMQYDVSNAISIMYIRNIDICRYD